MSSLGRLALGVVMLVHDSVCPVGVYHISLRWMAILNRFDILCGSMYVEKTTLQSSVSVEVATLQGSVSVSGHNNKRFFHHSQACEDRMLCEVCRKILLTPE